MIFFSTGCASNFEDEILLAGRELVSAINEFYQNMGHFPKALDELVPNYMEELPKLKVGAKTFFYSLLPEAHTSFRLSFRVRPVGFFSLGAKSTEYWIYDPWGSYIKAENIEVLISNNEPWYYVLHSRK